MQCSLAFQLGGAELGGAQELAVVEYPQLVAWLEFDSVKSVGVKNDGSSFYCSAFSTLALAKNGSWIVDEDSSFGTTRLG